MLFNVFSQSWFEQSPDHSHRVLTTKLGNDAMLVEGAATRRLAAFIEGIGGFVCTLYHSIVASSFVVSRRLLLSNPSCFLFLIIPITTTIFSMQVHHWNGARIYLRIKLY